MRKVLGIAINDLKGWSNWKYLGKNNLKYRLYVLWKGVLTRCFNKNYQDNHPTYKGCKIDKKWLNFSVFVEEIQKVEGFEMWANNPNKHIALDKDLKSKGEKIYSLETCTFLSARDNAIEMNNRCKEGIIEKTKPYLKKYIEQTKKKVKCEYPNGVIKIFNATRELTKSGFNRRHVYSCCIGDRKTHKKCKFSFA